MQEAQQLSHHPRHGDYISRSVRFLLLGDLSVVCFVLFCFVFLAKYCSFGYILITLKIEFTRTEKFLHAELKCVGLLYHLFFFLT